MSAGLRVPTLSAGPLNFQLSNVCGHLLWSGVNPTPLSQGSKHRCQGFAFGRERVFHPQRHRNDDLADNDAISLQLAQLLCKAALRYRADGAPNFIEPQGAAQQMEQDYTLPFPAYDFERTLNRAMLRMRIVGESWRAGAGHHDGNIKYTKHT